MQDALKKFGRYFLLDMIAQGGMAEIFRARQITTEGLGRTLVIKRIQPSYGNNQEFVSMFQSETRVMMNFNHPNIVQLQDYGEEDGQPFIAMEYIEGKSLRYVKDKILERTGNFPPDLAVYITAQAAAGLHYAHAYKDKLDGRPLNLVHRDISPQNILLSYEGNVKVIDFGIAKSAGNSEQTRAGVIKGKPSYLSPEQIDPGVGTLDGRSDLFSLGIVLWELLTGRKLFAGENDLATLRLIQNCQNTIRPPSEFNKLVPKELDYIVLQTLAKDREKRFKNALDLQRKLQRWLVGFNPEFNPLDLATEIKQLFANEIVEDRKNLQRLNDKAAHLLSLLSAEETSELLGVPVAKSAGPKASGVRNFETTQVDVRNVQVEPQGDFPKAPVAPIGVNGPGTRTQPSRASQVSRNSVSRPIPQRSSLGQSAPRGWIAVAGLIAAGWVFYGDSVRSWLGKAPKMQADDLGVRSPASVNPAASQAALVLQINPGGGSAKIRVNGKSIQGATPGTEMVSIPTSGEVSAPVAVGESFRVEVQAPGFKPKVIEGVADALRLSPGAQGQELTLAVELEPEVFGVLRYRSATASANLRVEVGGQAWIYRSSAMGGTEVVKLAPGVYRLEFFNILDMGQVVDRVEIVQGQVRELEVSLQPLRH
ncbi:MAG: serine/threonine protein kinase [Oligoflexia bacterium]